MDGTIRDEDLAMACFRCSGKGVVDDAPCVQCNGYGHHLTRSGQTLVEFLQRRGVAFPLSPLAEDELRELTSNDFE